VFVPIGVVVWLCHSAAWRVLGVILFGYERSRRYNWRVLLAPWPLFPPFLLIAFAQRAGGTSRYGDNPLWFKLGIWLKGLSETNVPLDVASLLVLGGAMAIALLRGRINWRLGWAALLVGLLTLVVPQYLGGGDLADSRLVPAALMLGCLAINAQVPRWVLWLAPRCSSCGWRRPATTGGRTPSPSRAP